MTQQGTPATGSTGSNPRPGQMTMAMQAIRVQTGPKVLRLCLVNQGRVLVGSFDLLAPLDLRDNGAKAVAYVRPHNIHLTKHKNGVPSIEVKVRHIHAAGPTARVDLERIDNGEELEAELPRREERELALSVGDTAWASLREARVFPAGDR